MRAIVTMRQLEQRHGRFAVRGVLIDRDGTLGKLAEAAAAAERAGITVIRQGAAAAAFAAMPRSSTAGRPKSQAPP
jgi:hypothetical protein